MKVVSFSLRLILAAVFLLSGMMKLLGDPQAFADGIAAFQVVPLVFINPLAITVPVLEILIAVALLIKPLRRAGVLLACLLACIFLFLFSWAAAHGIEVKCGCFGHWHFFEASTREGLFRSILLFVMAASLCFLSYFHTASAEGNT